MSKSIDAYRGDTVKIPITAEIPDGSTIRIHLRSSLDSQNFYNLSIIDGNVVIPPGISSACSGSWSYDIDITLSNGSTYTVEPTNILFKKDNSRIYEPELQPRTSDLERKTVIAEEFKFRRPNGDLEEIPSVTEIESVVDMVEQVSQNARQVAEDKTIFSQSELGRVTAEESRAESEGDNTKGRIKAELDRVAAEVIRVNSEGDNTKGRIKGELDRAAAEVIRVNSEGDNTKGRVKGELDRAAAEVIRVNSEGDNTKGRVKGELDRAAAEVIRVNSEGDNTKGRVKGELDRAAAEVIRVNSEGDNTKGRVKGELDRAAAEVIRVNSEGDNTKGRVKAELDRAAAEVIRVNSEGDNTKGRVKAELDRVAAEIIRINQEGLRQTGETMRTIQEASRQASEANRVSLTVAQRPLGSWSAATNTPTLANLTGTAGTWYECQVGGTLNGETYVPGDIVFCNQGIAWVRIPSYKGIATYIEAMVGVDNLKFITADLLYFINKLNQVPYQGAIDDLDMGLFNIKANLITAARFLNVTRTVQALTYSATTALDYNLGSWGIVTLTGNVTLALSNVPDGGKGQIMVIQDGTGSRLLTALTHTGLTVKFRGADATLTTTLNKSDMIQFERMGAFLYCKIDKNY